MFHPILSLRLSLSYGSCVQGLSLQLNACALLGAPHPPPQHSRSLSVLPSPGFPGLLITMAAISLWSCLAFTPLPMSLSALPQAGSDLFTCLLASSPRGSVCSRQLCLSSFRLSVTPIIHRCNPTLQGSLQSAAAFPAQSSPSYLHGTFTHGPTVCLTSTIPQLPGPAHLRAAWSGLPSQI